MSLDVLSTLPPFFLRAERPIQFLCSRAQMSLCICQQSQISQEHVTRGCGNKDKRVLRLCGADDLRVGLQTVWGINSGVVPLPRNRQFVSETI
jgi:hypothetical protein